MTESMNSGFESVGYSVDRSVLAYGLTANVGRMLAKVCKKLGVEVWETEDWVDLLAVPSFLSVCSFATNSAEEVEKIFSDLNEMVGHETALLFTDPVHVPLPYPLSKHVVKPRESLDETFLRLTVLNRMNSVRGHSRAATSYDTKLYRLFYILRTIRGDVPDSVEFLRS